MLKTILPPALIVAALGPMAACSDLQGALDFADERDSFQARRDMLQDRSNTAFSAVPDSGTSTYYGEASLGVGTRDDGVVLLGDSELTVDFGANTVGGFLSGFSGFDSSKEFSEYRGRLVFQNGVLGVDRPNDLESQIVGTLTADSRNINVDAFWEGDLRGTPIGGILGDTSGSNSTFTLDGDVVAGGIIVAVSN